VAEEEGVLPLIHGLDSVRGANHVYGSTLLPHQFGLGATFNPDLARQMGRIAAQDTQAAGTYAHASHPQWPPLALVNT
jgi:beta-glucosidase-like glycosyl hydrolase